METPHPDGGSDRSWGTGSTLRRGATPAVPSTASLEHLRLPAGSSEAGGEFLDEKAETVIRRPEGGSSGHAAASPGGLRPAPATPVEVAGVLLGSRLSHFHLQELIGGGGMGAVFRARDERLDRTVAIKVIPFVGDDPELQRRFRNEAQSAARLDHPNIARVFDVGMFEGWRYIVFEHIEGTNLRDLVARDGVLSIDDAVFYTRQIAEALHHASGRGVVHRDVKPSNILVNTEGDTKLVDMGLARSDQLDMSGDMTASGVTLGTFDYISPEQARDPRDADVRSDLYSLGCTLFFMLTGRPPFPGGTMLQKLLNHGNSPPPDPQGFRPEVSDDLTAIIHKMLAKSPEARYQRALDLVADLRELAIREELPRAQSQGTLTISRDPLSPGPLVTHLPWLVAASLLLLGAVVLQVMASLREDAFLIEVPTSAVTMRPASEAVEQPATPADAAGLRGGPQPAAAEPGAAAGSGESRANTAADIAAQPPPPASSAIARLQDRSAAASPPPERPVAPRIDKIIIGPTTPTPTTLVATTLAEALHLAEEQQVNVIEIAQPVLESPPVRIPRSGLTLRSSVGGSEIRFITGELPPMQAAVMIDIGSHRTDFQDLHFSWNVRSAAIEGGALFSLRENKALRLTGCTISIENLAQREHVFAFQINASRDGRPASAPAPPAPLTAREDAGLSSPSGDTGTAAPDRLITPPRPPLPPLISIELKNVAARGEMTLVSLDDAALLQLNWDNGLLAVSRRMLEVAGARSPLSAAGNRIRLALHRVTVHTGEGLVRTRLGPSGDHPMLIDRDSRKVVYRSSSTVAPHIEFTGLKEPLEPEQLVVLRGDDNAYDHNPEDDWPMLVLASEAGERQVFWLSEMTAAARPPWSDEVRPLWGVRWSEPWDETLPASRMEPANFFQDGSVVSGFDRSLLPAFPDRVDNGPLDLMEAPMADPD